jgi:hypothetical protein
MTADRQGEAVMVRMSTTTILKFDTYLMVWPPMNTKPKQSAGKGMSHENILFSP